jgi:hypothetical protein
VKWIIFLSVVLVLVLGRKWLKGPWNWLKGKYQFLAKLYKSHQETLQRWAASRMTPFILIGLIFLFWGISGFITLVLIFLFWVSVVYQVLNFRWKKKTVPTPATEPEVIVDETAKAKGK